jgi:hypothetical protein
LSQEAKWLSYSLLLPSTLACDYLPLLLLRIVGCLLAALALKCEMPALSECGDARAVRCDRAAWLAPHRVS